MEYHVLSNSDIKTILLYGLFLAIVLCSIFRFLAIRDGSPVKTKKSLFGKIVPWLVVLVFISDLSLLVYRCIDYPWHIEPQPSQASAYRELNSLCIGNPIWGWANDYQFPLLSSLAGTILWLGWTVYAFFFKRSNTSWWKKTCKVIAYIIISITILGFQFHSLGDLWGYALLLGIVVALLWIAYVKPKEQKGNTSIETLESSQQTIEDVAGEDGLIIKNEESTRFMPKMAVLEDVSPPTSIEESPKIEQIEIVQEGNPTPQMPIIENVVPQETTPIMEQPPQNEVTHNHIEEQDMMYCKYCGKRIEADSSFCKYCGKRL